jgi:cyanophycinase
MPQDGTPHRGHGHLVIIGGGEDREDDKYILSRFAELSGGEAAEIAVVTAASRHHDEMMEVYEKAFGDLGVGMVRGIRVDSRADADDPRIEAQLARAGGIFMTGGDQRRLVSLIGGTVLSRAMHHAFAHGGCIGGTSAGASAISEHMLSAGEPVRIPDPMHPLLGAGLGFLRRATIDQHFSERRRLGRLLSVVAANPYLLGMGIDENTAVVVEPGAAIEVLGEGAVTVIDGREVVLNAHDVNESDRPQLSNIRLHLLPSGFHHRIDQDETGDARSLSETLRFLTSVPAPAQ